MKRNVILITMSMIISSSLCAKLIEMNSIADAKTRIDDLVVMLTAEIKNIETVHEKRLNDLDISTLPKNDADVIPVELKNILEPLSIEYNVGIEAEDIDF